LRRLPSRGRAAASAVGLCLLLGLAGAAGLGGCALLGGDGLFGPRYAWEEPPPPPKIAPVVPAGALTRTPLANDLEVLVLEDHRLPMVTLSVSVRRGSAIEEPARAGLAVYTSELMERGAGERDALALARAVDDLGASLDVAADWDSMTVTVSGLSRDLERLLEVLSDVVLRPRFDAGEGARARTEQLASLERAKDAPQTLLQWQVLKTLYPDHRYGLPQQGAPESVAGFDAGAARDFHRRIFLPNDAVLSAAGDVAAADLLERARGLFGPAVWQRGQVPDVGPPPPDRVPPQRRVVVVDRPDMVQSRIAFAHEGIRRNNPERIAANLMNDVLGGSGFSSRLLQRVRSEAGLTYSLGSGFSLRRHAGPFEVVTFTRVPETRRVIDLVLEELERMRREPPTAAELANAQSLAVGSFGLSLETSRAVMASLVELDVHGLPDDSLDTYRARVRAVTTRDTARVAKELLHPQRAAIVVVGPAKDLRPQLEGLGELEVVEP
jgi:zinc protease